MRPEDLAYRRMARDLLDREFASPLDVPAMARAAMMSTAHFSRRFHEAFGESPYGYLQTRRVRDLAVFLQVDDVDTACESLRTGGAEVLQEPTDQPYGVRDCSVRDPSGNQLRLSQRPAGEPESQDRSAPPPIMVSSGTGRGVITIRRAMPAGRRQLLSCAFRAGHGSTRGVPARAAEAAPVRRPAGDAALSAG